MNKKKHAMPPDATRDAEQLITRLATEPCACGTGIDHMVQRCSLGSVQVLSAAFAARDTEIARLTDQLAQREEPLRIELGLALHARDAYVEDLTDLRATLVARDVESAQLRKNLQVMALLQSPARMDAALEARDIELADLTAALHQVEKVLQKVITHFAEQCPDRYNAGDTQALLKEGRTVLALVQ